METFQITVFGKERLRAEAPQPPREALQTPARAIGFRGLPKAEAKRLDLNKLGAQITHELGPQLDARLCTTPRVANGELWERIRVAPDCQEHHAGRQPQDSLSSTLLPCIKHYTAARNAGCNKSHAGSLEA